VWRDGRSAGSPGSWGAAHVWARSSHRYEQRQPQQLSNLEHDIGQSREQAADGYQ